MTARTTSARSADRELGRDRGRTAAQWYCYVIGATLLIMGILGFTADANFDVRGNDATGGALQGDGFLGFEVSGWHNVVHLLSGLFLLLLAPKRATARLAALGFGVVYGIVTVIGMIDGNDVLGFIPVNAADNVLHLLLSAAGIISGLASPHDDRELYERDRSDRLEERTRSGRFDGTATTDRVQEPAGSRRA